jgi:hypothetical protein
MPSDIPQPPANYRRVAGLVVTLLRRLTCRQAEMKSESVEIVTAT